MRTSDTRTSSTHRSWACLAVGLLSCLCWGQAQAHGIWVAQRAGEWAVVLGEGAEDEAYKPEAVQQLQALTAQGTRAELKPDPRPRQTMLQTTPDTAIVGVQLEDGYWSQNAEGKWVPGSRLQVPDARKASYTLMFSRSHIAPAQAASTPLGLPLEIVPQSDPLALKPGAQLRVQVLFKGQPLAGARLKTDYLAGSASPSVRTDAKGYAHIRLRSAGLTVVQASHKTARTQRSEADEDAYSSTLAFAPPHAH